MVAILSAPAQLIVIIYWKYSLMSFYLARSRGSSAVAPVGKSCRCCRAPTHLFPRPGKLLLFSGSVVFSAAVNGMAFCVCLLSVCLSEFVCFLKLVKSANFHPTPLFILFYMLRGTLTFLLGFFFFMLAVDEFINWRLDVHIFVWWNSNLL